MQTLNEKFLEVCRARPGTESMRIKSRSGWDVYRYCQILEGALKVVSWLIAAGFKKQDRAVLIAENCPDWSMIYFGIILAGGISVPLDPQASEGDLLTFISDCEAKIVFIEDKLAAGIKGRVACVKEWIIITHGEKKQNKCVSFQDIIVLEQSASDTQLPSVYAGDIASIIYSSGTTSNPKGIQLSHKNLLSNFESTEQLGICSNNDTFISVLPLFHAYAFMGTLILPLFIGAKIAYPATLKSAELLEVMRETGVTIMVGVPELFSNISKSIAREIQNMSFAVRVALGIVTALGWCLRKYTGINLLKHVYRSLHERFGGCLRYFVSGGARLEPNTAVALQKFGFTILEGYGLTETSPIVSLNPQDAPKIGSVGKAVPGVEVKIADPDEKGVGEIAIRGNNIMNGYYRKPEETQKVIREGWFYSGDLGRMDSRGYLYIVGRLKEIIVLSSGKNIFPDEIEKMYLASPYIKEIGVFLSSGEEGQNLKAVVVPNLEEFKKSGDTTTTYSRLKWDIENISQQLSSYKRIMGFAVSQDELPRTRLGKIKRYLLSEIYRMRLSGRHHREEREDSREDDLALKTPEGRKIIEFLKKELMLKRPIRGSDHLELDLGIDSLSRVELIAAFEKLFSIRLSDDALVEVATVSDLINKICELADISTSDEVTDKSSVLSWHDILHIEPDGEHFEKINLNPGLFSRFFSYAIRLFFLMSFKVLFRMKVFGRENLPSKGPYIICCNHSSYLDAFFVLTGLSYDIAIQAYFVGFRDIFYQPAIRWAITLARLIAIDPSTELIRAMRAASYILRHNKILGIFPEGQRSIDGEVKEFKKGIGILAKELGMDIVPAAIKGSHEAWPRTKRFPKPHPIKIIFGKPISVGEIIENAPPNADIYKIIAEHLRQEVAVLHSRIVV